MSGPQERRMMDESVGFFGKLPAAGDFVQRRLPAGFVGAWDGWLQAAMLASRAALGDDWLGHYRDMAPWRFLLARGGVDAANWLGVTLPSLDRVGRYFPLTLALPVAGALDAVATLTGAGAWFAELEQAGHAALDPALDLAAWDERLAALPAPPLTRPPAWCDDATRPLRLSTAPLARRLARPDDVERVAAVVAAFRRPACLFAGAAPAMLLACEGLPGAEQSTALFDGRWAGRGWAYEGGPETRPAETEWSERTRPFSAEPN